VEAIPKRNPRFCNPTNKKHLKVMSMWFICIIGVGLLADAIRRYLRDGDEIPVVLGALACMISYRGWLLEQGVVRHVFFNYGIDFVFDQKSIVYASSMIIVGFVMLMSAYYCAKSKRAPVSEIDNPQRLRSYFLKVAPFLWGGGIVFMILFFLNAILFRESVDESGRVASSYSFLFGMGMTSFVIGFAVFADVVHRSSPMRYVYLATSAVFAAMTFNPSLRFQMLGWSLFLLIYFVRRIRPAKRLCVYAVAGLILGLGFTILGSFRYEESRIHSLDDKLTLGREDFLEANDVNFVDGMVMLTQVYPEHLNYAWGGEHLEILLRPIPRSLWPNKPKGSWVQKWANKVNSDEFSTGISPSIFGSFYAEAGVIGVVVFSLLYGFGLGQIYNWSLRFRSSLRTVIKAIVIASAFAVIRGGDLAGTVAFLGMSFWPISILFYFYIKDERGAQAMFRRLPPRLVHKASV
jgi:oligosaccharide repeat unit polymerase